MQEPQHPLLNPELLQHLQDVVKILSPFVLTIVGLVVYCWHRLEKTQDKQTAAFESHIREDDTTHDKLFTEIRNLHHKVDVLTGEHKSLTCIKE